MSIAGSNRRIRMIPQFEGMTCFEILHTNLWSAESRSDNSRRALTTSFVYRELRRLHGLVATLKRKRFTGDNNNVDTNDIDNDDSEESNEEEEIQGMEV